MVANSSAFATPLIAHKSRKSALAGEKMGKLVAPPFALEADGRKPAAGIRGLKPPNTSNSIHTTCLIDIV